MILIDQLMCIKYVLWRKTLFSNQKAILLSVMTILIFIAMNFHLNFTVKYDMEKNATSLIDFLLSSKTITVWINIIFRHFNL